MKPDGSGERMLTDGYHNEGPTWAPNGRVLMFFRDPGGNAGPSLYTVDITGRNEQRVPTPSYRLRSGLVAAVVVNPQSVQYANRVPKPPSRRYSPRINHSKRFPAGQRASRGLGKHCVKVDGTFA